MRKIKRLLSLVIAVTMVAALLVMPAAALSVEATPAQVPVQVNGKTVKLQAYCVKGNNYFRLRDVASVLSGSDKKFQIIYDGLSNRINLLPGTAYTPVGGELGLTETKSSVPASSTVYTVYIEGVKVDMAAYFIGVYNYVKLRDIAAAVNFGVSFISESQTIALDTAAGYVSDRKTQAELDITLVGDSLGVGVTPVLQDTYPKLISDAKVSRQFYEGYGVVQALLSEGRLGSVVVVELGTNGDIDESDLRALVDLIGGSRKIVFVNIQVDRSWCARDNKTLADVLPDYPNTAIADWYSASVGQPDYFASDMVHPNSAGALVLADVIADAVEQLR